MKPDGVTMESTEPTEDAAGEELPSMQNNITLETQAQPEVASNSAEAAGEATEDNGKQEAKVNKVEPQAAGKNGQQTVKLSGASVSSQRPGNASHRMANDVKSHNASAATSKKTATAAGSTAGAIPKKQTASTVKNHPRVPDKKPAGLARTTSVAAATVTNGTKPTTGNGSLRKRPGAETVKDARPKTSASANRTVASTLPKSSSSTTTKAVGGAAGFSSRTAASALSKPSTSTRPKVGGGAAAASESKTAASTFSKSSSSTSTKAFGVAAVPKTTRPATAPSTSRPPPTTSRPSTATGKPIAASTVSFTLRAKTAASRVATLPSTGRNLVVQPAKTAAAAKKDASRPPSNMAAKKPTASPAPKKNEPAKSTAAMRLTSAPKAATPAKTSVAQTRFSVNTKPSPSRSIPFSPAARPANGVTPKGKVAAKPSQIVQPFTATKKNVTTSFVATQSAAVAAEIQAEVVLPQESSAAEEVPTSVSAQNAAFAPQEVPQSPEVVSGSPVRTALPQTSPPIEHLENTTASVTRLEQIAAQPGSPPPTSPPDIFTEIACQSTDQSPSTSATLPPAAGSANPQIIPPTNLNEEEDEEEREGSQLVSVSEMSGTTQPTEESNLGSVGPVGGAAWRAGGVLLSELDSEEVSGSQQGASELSAPGVLEGTESMDDLGEGSLKGAIDMEGASAGSPDFEKVPDIPVNDFDEDEEDDSDRVCDMDVGSERTDEPQRPRHDNDVGDDEDEDDEDVEMASEGVTESGLESYGNADEDDFAEDERLDNLNRVAQLPPPPPLLPSPLPASQWDHPNPFTDPWAEPFELVQAAGAAAATVAESPSAHPWQLDSETPTQVPTQAWLEQEPAPLVPGNQEVSHSSSVKDETQNLEPRMYGDGLMDHSSPAPAQTLTPAPLSVPGMSQSSTLSSKTSTPKELGDHNDEGKLQPQAIQTSALSPQFNLHQQDMGSIHLERGDAEEKEEAEPETLIADEVPGLPAPTSNPSSSSVTEDEASDTEGEAQLDDPFESHAVMNVTTEIQPPAQRCLSVVEEAEEATVEETASGAAEDTTPPSATSMASYGFDTMTTASYSNAQSTGESCVKSPGVFSLEELSEEAKEPCLISQPHSQQCPSEQQYIECGKQEVESGEHVEEEESEEVPDPDPSAVQQPEENPDDPQPPYYSICEKNEDSFSGNV